MKPRRQIECVYYSDGRCTKHGFTIDPCKPETCIIADFSYVLIYADPEFEAFIDELNRRLDKGV